MSNEWKDREEGEPEPWQGDADAWRGGGGTAGGMGRDADGWRGELHSESDAWRASLPVESESWRGGASDGEGSEVAWRGEVHLEDWPEWNAGPEYKMWKKLKDHDA
jgi:hypothetical protein